MILFIFCIFSIFISLILLISKLNVINILLNICKKANNHILIISGFLLSFLYFSIMFSVRIWWVYKCLVNWFDKSWNDTKNNISKSSVFVVFLMCLLSACDAFLLSGNDFASCKLLTMVFTLYLFWKYSSSISSETPSNFQKIALRSCCLRNIEIPQKISSPWIVFCLLVNANVFAWVMHELELLVSNVSICENIMFKIQYKIAVF